jgi:hypothetical protein
LEDSRESDKEYTWILQPGFLEKLGILGRLLEFCNPIWDIRAIRTILHNCTTVPVWSETLNTAKHTKTLDRLQTRLNCKNPHTHPPDSHQTPLAPSSIEDHLQITTWTYWPPSHSYNPTPLLGSSDTVLLRIDCSHCILRYSFPTLLPYNYKVCFISV